MADSTAKELQIDGSRRIALDIRARSFGFVVFENSMVLDAGVRTCDRDQPSECLLPRLRAILTRYDPAVVILKGTPRDCVAAGEHCLLESIRRSVKACGIDLSFTSHTRLRRFFALHQAKTKQEIASVVARHLPELAWTLPPKRRTWDSEPYWASVFDAAALALPHIFPFHARPLDNRK